MKAKNEAASPQGANRNNDQKKHYKDTNYLSLIILSGAGTMLGVLIGLIIQSL